MESRTQMGRAEAAALLQAHRRHIAAHRRILGFEAVSALLVGLGLVEAVQYVEHALPELQVAFAIAVFVFSAGFFLLLHHVGEVLDLECPRCHEAFHGDGGEHVATPLRRSCASCGLPVSPRRS